MAGNLSKELFNAAQKIFPGGVNSPVRSFQAVGGEPVFMEQGKGSKIIDADHKEYIDYILSWGPLILGHANKDVLEKVKKTLDKGLSFGTSTGFELELGKLMCDVVPSLEMLRFVNSGTESTMSALRLARAYTDKKKILKFDGCYHGHADMLLVQAGSGVATLSIAGSQGVLDEAIMHTVSVPYNDLDAVKKAIANDPKNFAAIIVEPVAGNMGVVLPKEGFLEGLRAICDEHEIVLIFDEVMTGFRLSLGGAQTRLNITPDLSCFGKVIGGGLPVGAFGGKKEIMQKLAPLGGVYQAGTLSGNPVCMAAGIKTLKLLKEPEVYEKLEYRTQHLTDEMKKRANKKNIRLCINQMGSMFSLFFDVDEVSNYEQAKKASSKMFIKYFKTMMANAVLLPPSPFESWFVSTAHSERDIEDTIKAHEKALEF